MPTDERSPWGGDHAWWSAAGPSGQRRPPWWPDGEPWPPRDREAWRGASHRFVRRAIRFAVAFAIFVALTVVGLAWLLSAVVGEQVLAAVVPAVAVLIGLVVVLRLVRSVRRAAAPLGDLVEVSERVAAGEVGAQVTVRGPREVRAMATAFNAMSARLAEHADERRRLLADVSHELRTPISVIQGNVEAMLDGVHAADREHLEGLLAEARLMERLIEDLGTLSLADAGALVLRREPTDLAAVASDMIRGFEAQARDAGVTLSARSDEVPSLSLDPGRIHQVLGNLIANALRHTPAGGSVMVTVEPTPEGGAELAVRDTGTGMPADAVEHAFDRFWRSGESAGAGLGLAIVRDLVEAHGGTVTLESQRGSGTVVRCRFPVGQLRAAFQPASRDTRT